MRKHLLSAAACASLAFGAQAAATDAFTDLLKSLSDYDAIKTAGAITNMAKEENLGMEVFRASGLKGDLYTGGYGVNLVKDRGLLSNRMTIEGFCDGNFDLTLRYALFMQPDELTLTARQTKPDGTPAEYAGMEATITPCIVIKDFIYVPVKTLPLFGYASNADPTGLLNLHFNAIAMPDIESAIADIIPPEALAAIIKAAVDSQLKNDTIKRLVGSIIDSVIGDGSDPSKYLSLLDGAKVNAFQITINPPAAAAPDDNGVETGEASDTRAASGTVLRFNGYELHSIKATATVTDRIITDIKNGELAGLSGLFPGGIPFTGYGTKSDEDPTRTYRIASVEDGNGRFSIYNFNNAGMALHSSVETVTDDASGSSTKRFVNTLSPVTGDINMGEGVFRLDNHQQLGSDPVLSSDILGGNLSSLNITQLWPVDSKSLPIIGQFMQPTWIDNNGVQSSAIPGQPTHTGENLWHQNDGGKLKTEINNAEISIGDYCPAAAKYSPLTGISSLRTTSGPIVYDTRWIMEGMSESLDVTHDVTLDLNRIRFEGCDQYFEANGLWLRGDFIPSENSEFVESHELYVVPMKIDDISKPYVSVLQNGSSLYRLHAEHGLEYRFGATHNTWTEAVCLTPYAVQTPYAATTDDPHMFEAFIPYSDMAKYTRKELSWTAGNPDENDTYTLFVKTNYTEASHLAPTFHALRNITRQTDQTTGIGGAISDGTHSWTVSATNGAIRVNGADNLPVSIHSVSGITVYSAIGDATVSAAPGIYMVTVGTATTKVAVK